jgi:hypothetical protein
MEEITKNILVYDPTNVINAYHAKHLAKEGFNQTYNLNLDSLEEQARNIVGKKTPLFAIVVNLDNLLCYAPSSLQLLNKIKEKANCGIVFDHSDNLEGESMCLENYKSEQAIWLAPYSPGYTKIDGSYYSLFSELPFSKEDLVSEYGNNISFLKRSYNSNQLINSLDQITGQVERRELARIIPFMPRQSQSVQTIPATSGIETAAKG